MQNGILHIFAKDGACYRWEGCSKIRQASKELRWTNARGENRSMANAFIASWRVDMLSEVQ